MNHSHLQISIFANVFQPSRCFLEKPCQNPPPHLGFVVLVLSLPHQSLPSLTQVSCELRSIIFKIITVALGGTSI